MSPMLVVSKGRMSPMLVAREHPCFHTYPYGGKDLLYFLTIGWVSARERVKVCLEIAELSSDTALVQKLASLQVTK